MARNRRGRRDSFILLYGLHKRGIGMYTSVCNCRARQVKWIDAAGLLYLHRRSSSCTPTVYIYDRLLSAKLARLYSETTVVLYINSSKPYSRSLPRI